MNEVKVARELVDIANCLVARVSGPPDLYMQQTGGNRIDLFAVFPNANSLDASESKNMKALEVPVTDAIDDVIRFIQRKGGDAVEKRHPFYARGHSFDGEKMLYAKSLVIRNADELMDAVISILKRQGFKQSPIR